MDLVVIDDSEQKSRAAPGMGSLVAVGGGTSRAEGCARLVDRRGNLR
jgi:hypothetical protein